jgi:hypothetical protein
MPKRRSIRQARSATGQSPTPLPARGGAAGRRSRGSDATSAAAVLLDRVAVVALALSAAGGHGACPMVNQRSAP